MQGIYLLDKSAGQYDEKIPAAIGVDLFVSFMYNLLYTV